MDARSSQPTPPAWAPSRLRRLSRRPGFYWLLGATLVLVTSAVVYRLVNDAQTNKAAYGETVSVAVTHRDAQLGEPLAQVVRVMDIPVALVPNGALDSSQVNEADQAEASLGRALRAGAVVTDLDVNTGAVSLQDAAVVAVPIGAATPPLTPGQRVVVVLHQDAFSGETGTLIDAVTYGVNDNQVLIAVPRTDLQQLSAAIGANGVTLALAGPS